jgi:hypothetical protein
MMADAPGTGPKEPPKGLLKGSLDAIHHEDDRIGGMAVTQLAAPLLPDEEGAAVVQSTIGFGEDSDGTEDARLMIGGELVLAAGRTTADPYMFTGLSRGEGNTQPSLHPPGTLVFDLSRNTSAVDRLRRGFFVNTAVGEDLTTIARNLGLHRCPGMTTEQLRRVVKAVAYLPKNTRDAFEEALRALTDDPDLYRVRERTVTDPWKTFVDIVVQAATDLRGRFVLNGGERTLTITVDRFAIAYEPLGDEMGVYDDTILTRRGVREGFTNHAAGGRGVGWDVVTAPGETPALIELAASPGAAETPVIVDYTAFHAHYLAANENVRQGSLQQDMWAYLSDPLLTSRCLLEQIRMAGTTVELKTRTT